MREWWDLGGKVRGRGPGMVSVKRVVRSVSGRV